MIFISYFQENVDKEEIDNYLELLNEKKEVEIKEENKISKEIEFRDTIIAQNNQIIKDQEKTIKCYFDFIEEFSKSVNNFDNIRFEKETIMQHACNSKDDKLFKYLRSIYKDGDIEIKDV